MTFSFRGKHLEWIIMNLGDRGLVAVHGSWLYSPGTLHCNPVKASSMSPWWRMSPWWSLCTLYVSHARWSYHRWLRSLLLCACSMCHVNCSSAVTSHCLLIEHPAQHPAFQSPIATGWGTLLVVLGQCLCRLILTCHCLCVHSML